MREETKYIVIHCSQTRPSQNIGAKDIDSWHSEQGWLKIGYATDIKRDGTIEAARPEDMSGAHAPKANHRSVAICLIGGSQDDGTGWENNFSEEQFKSLKDKVEDIQGRYEIQYIIGHNEIDDRKECPAFDVSEWVDKNGLV